MGYGNGRRKRRALHKSGQQFIGGHKAFVTAEISQCFHQQNLVGLALVHQSAAFGFFHMGGCAGLLYFLDGCASLPCLRGGSAAPVKGGGRLRLILGLILIAHRLSKVTRREPAFPWSWYRPRH